MTEASGGPDWVRLLPSTAVARGECRTVTLAGHDDLVVWRTVEGELCVMDARCPHQWSHLGSEGVVDGDTLVCTTHFWCFDTAGAGWKQAMSGRRDEKAGPEVFASQEDDGVIWARVRIRASSLAD